jgi:hypothetical protein
MAQDDFKIKISADGIDKLINSMEELITLQKEIITNQAQTTQGAVNLANAAGKAGDELGQAGKKAGGFLSTLGKIGKGAVNVGKGILNVGKRAGEAFGKVAKWTGAAAIFGAFTGALKGSQKATDLLAQGMGILNGLVANVTDAVTKNVEAIGKQNGGFQATQKLLSGALQVALNTFVLALQGIKLVTLQVQKTWEDSIFGSGDTKKIEELGKEIDSTKTKMSEAGDAILKGGKQIAQNFGDAVGEIADGLSAVAEGVQEGFNKTDFKKLNQQAERAVQLQKQAALAEAARQKIQLDYQATQEKLRQLRDDETKSLGARLEANDKLLASQKEQAEKEREQINTIIAAAAAQYALTKSNDDLVKLKTAQLQLSELNERITGQESEALQNQNNLVKERIELQKKLDDARYQASQEEKQSALDFDIEMKKIRAGEITDEFKKAQELIKIEKERIARQRALNEENYNKKSDEIDAELKRLKDAGLTETQEYGDLMLEKLDLDTEYNDQKRQLALDTAQVEIDASNSVKDNDKKNKDEQKAFAKELYDAAVAVAGQTLSTIGAMQEAAKARELKAAGDDAAAQEEIQKKYFEQNKKLQIAEAIISTITGAVSAFTSVQNLNKTVPGLGIAVGAVLAALVTATGMANVAQIQATQYQSSGGSGSKFADGGLLKGKSHSEGGIKSEAGELEGGEFVVNKDSTAKNFALLESINSNKVARFDNQMIPNEFDHMRIVALTNILREQNMSKPNESPVIKTYVVASEVSSQQEADKRISDLAAL